MFRFTETGEEIEVSDEEENDDGRDPNVIKSSKKTRKDKVRGSKNRVRKTPCINPPRVLTSYIL